MGIWIVLALVAVLTSSQAKPALPLVQDPNRDLALCLDCNKTEATANPQNTDNSTANQPAVFRVLNECSPDGTADCTSDKDCCSGKCQIPYYLFPAIEEEHYDSEELYHMCLFQ